MVKLTVCIQCSSDFSMAKCVLDVDDEGDFSHQNDHSVDGKKMGGRWNPIKQGEQGSMA